MLGKPQGRKPRREPQVVENATPYGDSTDRSGVDVGGEAGTLWEKAHVRSRGRVQAGGLVSFTQRKCAVNGRTAKQAHVGSEC